MDVQDIYKKIQEYGLDTKVNSEHSQHTKFIQDEGGQNFAPLPVVLKKQDKDEKNLIRLGFLSIDLSFIDELPFKTWYEKKYAQNLSIAHFRKVVIFYRVGFGQVLQNIDNIYSSYLQLRKNYIILNKKNFPIQLGEWYAKSLFGIQQVKSTSERGFDFELNQKRIEVKVCLRDKLINKGVKIKKSSLKLSEVCFFIYLGAQFRINDICIVESGLLLKNFNVKGHTLSLKDEDLRPYFISESDHCFDHLVNKEILLQFSSNELVSKLKNKLN